MESKTIKRKNNRRGIMGFKEYLKELILGESENVMKAEQQYHADQDTQRRLAQNESARNQEKRFNQDYSTLSSQQSHSPMTPAQKAQAVENTERRQDLDKAKFGVHGERQFNQDYSTLSKQDPAATPSQKIKQIEKVYNQPPEQPQRQQTSWMDQTHNVFGHDVKNSHLAAGGAAALAAGAGALALRKMLKNKKATQTQQKPM
jgi:hypothetical protein